MEFYKDKIFFPDIQYNLKNDNFSILVIKSKSI